MSTDNLQSLEGRVERLWLALNALQAQVAALSQAGWQMAGRPSGGGGTLLRAVLTANLSAGSPGSPTSTTGTLLVPDGSGNWTATGGTSITIYNEFATGITVSGSKFCWVMLDPADLRYYLIVCDC